MIKLCYSAEHRALHEKGGPPSRVARPSMTSAALLNRHARCLRCILLRQRQGQHAVLELGLGLGGVHRLRQLERTGIRLMTALAVEHRAAVLLLGLAFGLGTDRDPRAVDFDGDVLLLGTRQFGMHLVVAVML